MIITFPRRAIATVVLLVSSLVLLAFASRSGEQDAGANTSVLQWKDKKFVYSGDTTPNKWFLDQARDADLLIHECYLSVQQFIELKHYDPERARIVATVVHTPPSACGKIFSMLKPRMAVAYHTFNDFNTAPDIIAGIRESYGGPLMLANDLLIWNIDTDTVRVRRVIGTDEPLPATPPQPAGPPDPSERTEMSDWLKAGRVDLLSDRE